MKLAATVFLALIFLNSCAGGGSVQPQPTATPDRGVCNALLVNDPQLALVTPAAGATGVPTTIGSITFSASRLYNGLTLSPNDGSGNVAGGPITPSNGNYVSALPVLRSHVTYSVTIFPSAGACVYFPGSFTTS
ncbi:MAG TPA: hypothetical protein VN224_08775 [Xanthomonadales bacterium]|nr:hypothetical protein [Xanthomonadales bacterium]